MQKFEKAKERVWILRKLSYLCSHKKKEKETGWASSHSQTFNIQELGQGEADDLSRSFSESGLGRCVVGSRLWEGNQEWKLLTKTRTRGVILLQESFQNGSRTARKWFWLSLIGCYGNNTALLLSILFWNGEISGIALICFKRLRSSLMERFQEQLQNDSTHFKISPGKSQVKILVITLSLRFEEVWKWENGM